MLSKYDSVGRETLFITEKKLQRKSPMTLKKATKNIKQG